MTSCNSTRFTATDRTAATKQRITVERVDSRWSSTSSDAYDARWKEMAAKGESIHGEADFVCRFDPTSVLDAGCGTGRVAIELARRGIDVVGVDLDESMLAAARAKAPDLTWITADLLDVELGRAFDVVVMPGNVMIFVAPGTETAVVANMARHVSHRRPADRRIPTRPWLRAPQYDADCDAAGLALEALATRPGKARRGGRAATTRSAFTGTRTSTPCRSARRRARACCAPARSR